MYKSNKYLHFYGYAKKKISLLQYSSMCLSYHLIQKVTYIFVHMGTKKTKKLTITIFITCKFIECRSYHDIKGLVVCMFSDYAHIDHIDYNKMCVYLFHQKEFLFSLVFLLGVSFQVVTQLCYEYNQVLPNLFHFQLDKYTLNMKITMLQQ